MLRKIMLRYESFLWPKLVLLMSIILICITTAEAGKTYTISDNQCTDDSTSTNNACSYLDSKSCDQPVDGTKPIYYCQGYSVPGQCASFTGKNCSLTVNKPCGTQMNCDTKSPVILSGGITPDCTGAPDTCTTQ